MVARLRTRLGGAGDDALLLELIESARETVLAYTRRRALPRALEGCVVELAVILYNRRGMEGEAAHSEGSVHRSAPCLPDYLSAQLRAWRLAESVHG